MPFGQMRGPRSGALPSPGLTHAHRHARQACIRKDQPAQPCLARAGLVPAFGPFAG